MQWSLLHALRETFQSPYINLHHLHLSLADFGWAHLCVLRLFTRLFERVRHVHTDIAVSLFIAMGALATGSSNNSAANVNTSYTFSKTLCFLGSKSLGPAGERRFTTPLSACFTPTAPSESHSSSTSNTAPKTSSPKTASGTSPKYRARPVASKTSTRQCWLLIVVNDRRVVSQRNQLWPFDAS